MTSPKPSPREEFPKAVILGCHPGKTYEEALEEERGFGCGIRFRNTGKSYIGTKKVKGVKTAWEEDVITRYTEVDCGWMGLLRNDTITIKQRAIAYGKYEYVVHNPPTEEVRHYLDVEIIGLPITIGRVMQALKGQEKDYYFLNGIYERADQDIEICQWLLAKEGREATDEDQNIEDIRKLLAILKS